jgi:two-component system NtrC family sensor kinase
MADSVRLIVEDGKPGWSEIIAKHLSNCGFTVDVVGDRRELYVRAGQDPTRFGPILDPISWAEVRAAFDSLPIRIMFLDREHRYRYVNKAWCEFNRTTEDVALGRTIVEVLGEEVFGIDKEQAERALAGEIVHRDGWGHGRRGWQYVQTTFAPVREAAGGIKGYFRFSQDLTHLRETERALHQSEKMAALGSLLSGVAHELNNPLSIVIGNALLLAEETEGLPLAERAQRVQAAAERCGRIVRSFLAMARQRKAERRPTTVRALVDDTLQLLAYTLRTSGVTVEQDIAPDLPTLTCDPDQIIQVLTNLLINARHVLEERPQPRRVRLTARADAEWAQIEVADNGSGVAEAIRSRIFDPFFTTKPAGSGSGIGLAVSRGMVEAHGGSLSLAPADGEGARFVIRLPLTHDAPSQSEPQSDAKGAAGAPRSLAPATRTALVVDDEPEIGELLAAMLRKLGYRIEVKASGEDAQAALSQRDYDVVLSDLRMPGLDGPALYAWMAEHRPHLCARTAFITADTLSPSAHQFLASAGRPVLEKPFVPAELRQLLVQLQASSRAPVSSEP